MTSVMMSRSHSGDPAALLNATSRSADVLLVRPKPIRPSAHDSPRSTSECRPIPIPIPAPVPVQGTCYSSNTSSGRSSAVTMTRSSNAYVTEPEPTTIRALGAFTVVTPMPLSTTTSMYERELCTLLKQTALNTDTNDPERAAAALNITRNRNSRTPIDVTSRRPCSACLPDAAILFGAHEPVPRSPLTDLPPVAMGARAGGRPTSSGSRHYSEPLAVAGLRSPSSCSSSATVIDYIAEVDCAVAPATTRKRRHKETDENATDTHPCLCDQPESTCVCAGIESGEDEIGGNEPCSASPARADSKCRRRIAASTVRPSINAEKMLIASATDRLPHRHSELLLRRSSDWRAEERGDGTPNADPERSAATASANDSPLAVSPNSMRAAVEASGTFEWQRLAALHQSFSMTDSLLTGTFSQPTASGRLSSNEPVTTTSLQPDADANANLDVAMRFARPAASSDDSSSNRARKATDSNASSSSNSNSNTDEIQQSEEPDVCANLPRKTINALPLFTPQCGTQFHIINELDIDQIENN